MPIATLADIDVIEQVPLEKRLAANNVFDLLRHAAALNPNKPALLSIPRGMPDDVVTTITYRQFLQRIVQSANLFGELGIGPTDVVSLLMPIMPETFCCLFGAETQGIGNPINYLLEPGQIAGILNEAGTKVLVCCDPSIVPDIWPKVQAIRSQVPTLEHVVVVGGKPAPDVIEYEEAVARHDGTRLKTPRTYAFDEVAGLFHTGGTTGVPKLAQHTHGGLATHSLTLSMELNCGPDDTMINGLPPFHVGGATCAGLMPLSVGATVVMIGPLGMRSPAAVNNFWALVQMFRPTILGLVPTSWGALLNVPSEGFDLSSVKLANCGGATMPIEVANGVKQKLKVPVVEGYGMTEVHGFSTMNPAGGESRIGSVGFHAPYCEIVVVQLAEGRIARRCPTDEIGAVLMRGPQVFKGYVAPGHNRDAWVEPEAGDANKGRWLNSGDLGRFDAEGYLWLTGRAKDLIIRGGHNIDPIVIEEVLHQHPAVESAAAVGRPDRHAGELPVAFVQLRPGAKATAEELQAFARERIPERAAAPVEVTVLDLMPVTGVGKIFKPQLRFVAAQHTFARLLEPLKAEGIETEVSVGPHREFGTLATVRIVKAASPQKARERINEVLSGFQIRHQVADA